MAREDIGQRETRSRAGGSAETTLSDCISASEAVLWVMIHLLITTGMMMTMMTMLAGMKPMSGMTRKASHSTVLRQQGLITSWRTMSPEMTVQAEDRWEIWARAAKLDPLLIKDSTNFSKLTQAALPRDLPFVRCRP